MKTIKREEIPLRSVNSTIHRTNLIRILPEFEFFSRNKISINFRFRKKYILVITFFVHFSRNFGFSFLRNEFFAQDTACLETIIGMDLCPLMQSKSSILICRSRSSSIKIFLLQKKKQNTSPGKFKNSK